MLVAWLICLLMFRPFSIGEYYSQEIFLLLALITLILVTVRPGPLRLFARWSTVLIVSVCVLVNLYFLMQGFVLSSARTTVLNATVLSIGSIVCCALVLNKDNVSFIFKVFVVLHVLLGISGIISTFLYALLGLNIAPLVIMRFPIYSETAQHLLVVPFSLYWSWTEVLGQIIYRFTGGYREPGAAQIFFVTAYLMTYFIQIRGQGVMRSILLFSSLITLSTAGVFNLVIGVTLLYLFNGRLRRLTPRTLGALIIIVILVLFLVIIPSDLNLFTRLSSNVSGISRLRIEQENFQLFMRSPIWGVGYYSGFELSDTGAAGSRFLGLTSTAYQIGVVGLFLYGAAWWAGLFKRASRSTWCIYAPGLISLLVFQPIYNSTFIWFLLVLDTSSIQLQSFKWRWTVKAVDGKKGLHYRSPKTEDLSLISGT